MATLTYLRSFGDDWVPDTVEGGTITTRTATLMQYTSDMGYTITLRGSGMTYDVDGMPNGGTVNRVTISLNGQSYLDYTGVSAGLERLSIWAFGYDRDAGSNPQGPDGSNFMEHLWRGNDLLAGSAQDDVLWGGIGNDTVNAGAGDDYIFADAGNDAINGGIGDSDELTFHQTYFDPTAFRGALVDALAGTVTDSWGGQDTISGIERFRDSVFNDTLLGTNDDNRFIVTRGADSIDGRDGWDELDYSRGERWGAHRGINANLGTGVIVDSWRSRDTVSNIEAIKATGFNDTLVGTNADETFVAGAGKDVINMGGGWDRLAFFDVGENAPGGHGISVNLGQTNTIIDDGYGNAENATGVEAIDGSMFGDRILGNNGSNRFWGNDGNDTLMGGGGEDWLDGAEGRDSVVGGLGDDHLGGQEGNDTLVGNAGADDFNFNRSLATGGVDVISDMTVGIDEIWVESFWGGGLVAEDITAAQFRSGAGVTTANTAAQRFIYNTTTGDLYFDADGNGGTSAAVKFATLSNHAALTFADIHIML